MLLLALHRRAAISRGIHDTICRSSTFIQSQVAWRHSSYVPRGTKGPGFSTSSTLGDIPTTSATEILDQISTLRSQVQTLRIEENGVREKLLEETQLLVRDLELPWNVIQRFCFLNVWEIISVDIATNMGIFTVIENHTPDPVSATTIAEQCKAEPLLVERLLRFLSSFGATKEHAPDNTTREYLYTSTTISRTFASRSGASAVKSCLGFCAPGWLHLAKEIRAQNNHYSVSATNSVYNKVYNAPDKTLWEILASTEYVEPWGTFMETWNTGHKDWLDYYPIQERLIDGASPDPDSVFMVDIGGCQGTQASSLRDRFPDAALGKFIIQDLPNVLPNPAPLGTETFAGSFFDDFPVALQGARLYYMRHISHDWSQEDFVRILKNVKGAMKKGYSKLIVSDWIVPERNPPQFMLSQDLNMLSFGGGEERTERRFREAIRQAGLQVTGVWDLRDGVSEGVIECEVA